MKHEIKWNKLYLKYKLKVVTNNVLMDDKNKKN